MIFGVFAIEAGLSVRAVQAMSFFLFAGSAQIVIIQLLSGGAPFMFIITIVLIINVRHLLYSASVASHLTHLKLICKGFLAYC